MAANILGDDSQSSSNDSDDESGSEEASESDSGFYRVLDIDILFIDIITPPLHIPHIHSRQSVPCV